MGRGERSSKGIKRNPRDLLYGRRPSGDGPLVDSDIFTEVNIIDLSQRLVKQLAADRYLRERGSLDLTSHAERRVVFDIFTKTNDQQITRLIPEVEGNRSGVRIERVAEERHGQDQSAKQINVPFDPGSANAADLASLALNLIVVNGNKLDLDYVERELDWTELDQHLGRGQALELAVNQPGEQNSGILIHDYLVNMIDEQAGYAPGADDLIYNLGTVQLEYPEGFLAVMYHNPLGRQLLAGQGPWRVRQNRKED